MLCSDDDNGKPTSQEGDEPSSDQELNADDIGERVMANYFSAAWGPKPVQPDLPPQPSNFARLHRSPATMYVSGLIDVAEIQSELLVCRLPERAPVHPKMSPELLRRRDEVRALAEKMLGSPRDAKRWLETPLKFALDRKRPAEWLQTLEGCDKVEEFLNNLYS